jgi:large subunit ribosomal protein L22
MEARAIQRAVRQSPRKMRLVVDQIRGRAVPEAYAILRFSKKRAAVQIHKVLKSAVANAEQAAQRSNQPIDVDRLRVIHAVVNEGTTLKRFTSAAMGRATPVKKRTSHVEIRVAEGTAVRQPTSAAAPAAPAKTPPSKAPEKAKDVKAKAPKAPAAPPRGQPTRAKAAGKGEANPGATPRGKPAPKRRGKNKGSE